MNRRGWSENLTFCTGLGWLGGTLAGVGRGAYAFRTTPPEPGVVGPEPRKIWLNRLLNEVGRNGRRCAHAPPPIVVERLLTM